MEMAMTYDSIEEQEMPIARRVARMVNRTKAGRSIEIKGAEFGRAVESSVSQLDESHDHFVLKIRQKKRAVVLGLEEYEELMRLRVVASELSVKYQELKLRTDGDKFDQMYAAMQTIESKQAVDSIFDMDEDELDLAGSYVPGETESK